MPAYLGSQAATRVYAGAQPVTRVYLGTQLVWSATGALPSAPSSVTSTQTTSTATINWLPPASTGGQTIIGYRVSRDGTDLNGFGPWSTTIAATEKTFTFHSLQTGVAYTLSVTAILSNQDSPTATVTVTLTPPPAPSSSTFALGVYFQYDNPQYGVTAYKGWVG